MSFPNSIDDEMTEAANTNAALAMPVAHDAMFGRVLPSELWKQVTSDDSFDAESVLQRVLSALAFQQEILTATKKNELDIPRWLWKNMANELEEADPEPPAESPNYQWWVAARVLHKVLPQMSPFEIHTVASDAIVFTDGSPSHGVLCILLCTYALRRCDPPKLEVRWKRWQSIVCETIRMFQHYGVELEAASMPLYIDYVAPSCTHVIHKLPEEAFHAALLSGLIGTVTTLVKRECREQTSLSSGNANLLAHVLQMMELTRNILDSFGYDERLVLLHPWRAFRENVSSQEKNSKVDFMQRHSELAWWAVNTYRHEKVAGMDTNWDTLGVSVLTLVGFESRSLVWSSAFVWKMWFPHVLALFKSTAKMPHLHHVPLILLDNLLQVIPEKSLPESHTSRAKADSPLETFQQLSNRILAKPSGEEDDALESEMEESVTSTTRIVGIMKELLSKYQPTNQVKIIRKLVHDCPHHGLQAKFMDLLRAVIFEPSAADALWTYVGSFVKDLTAHIDEEKEALIRVDHLVQKVEVYVGAVTMIQLWCMVKGKVPPRVRKQSLKDIFRILQIMMKRWMTDSMSMPPDDYYRLYLLEGALQEVIRILEEAREGNKMTVDGSSSHHSVSSQKSSSIPATDGADTEPMEEISEEKKESRPEPVHVSLGDADLFNM